MLTIKPVDFQRQTSPHGVGANTVGLVWKETDPRRYWFMELWVPHAYYQTEQVCTRISLRYGNPSRLIKYLNEVNTGIGQHLTSDQFSFKENLTLYVDACAYDNFLATLQRLGCKKGLDYDTDPNTYNMYFICDKSLALTRMINRNKQK
jgi:hypothetical protein